MDKDKFLNSGLLEQYVLGITTPEESAEVERYLHQFPEIEQELSSMRSAVENYAKQYAINPPPEVKGQIMEEIDQITQPKPNTNSSPTWRWLPIAALLASLYFVFSFYQDNQRLKANLEENEAALQSFQASCEEEKKKCAETAQLYAYLTDDHTQAVTLRGTPLAPDAHVIVYWNEQQQNAMLNVLQLPKPPKGKQYQLWADVEGEMIDMGIFDTETASLVSMTFIAHAESLNITLEPEGGSEEPTVELLQANGYIG